MISNTDPSCNLTVSRYFLEIRNTLKTSSPHTTIDKVKVPIPK